MTGQVLKLQFQTVGQMQSVNLQQVTEYKCPPWSGLYESAVFMDDLNFDIAWISSSVRSRVLIWCCSLCLNLC